ncbi:MAG: hypothetical protein VX068_02145, partial [Candidatus Thermoplasmatota archaeon]|nr:hypothetical protein [Candidatus Thermoplasmatota archaeon]
MVQTVGFTAVGQQLQIASNGPHGALGAQQEHQEKRQPVVHEQTEDPDRYEQRARLCKQGEAQSSASSSGLS